MFFFLKNFRFKNLIFRFIHHVSAFTLSLPDYNNKELFNVQFLPTVLENKETYQLDGVKLTKHFIL